MKRADDISTFMLQRDWVNENFQPVFMGGWKEMTVLSISALTELICLYRAFRRYLFNIGEKDTS